MINPTHFDLQSLRLFLQVAKFGSLTKAAEESGLTLSALSKRMSDLERLVGSPLVLRTRRGVTLTPAGLDLVKHSRGLLNQVSRMAVAMSDYSQGLRGSVQVWANPSSVIQFLPGDLATFTAANPLVRIRLKEEMSTHVVAALRSGEADIGIFWEHANCVGLDVFPYREDKLVALIPLGHALARRRAAVRFEELLAFDFVGLNEGSSLLRLLETAAEELSSSLKLKIQVTSFDAVCRMVEAGLGISVLPEGCLRLDGDTTRFRRIDIAEPWARRQLQVGIRQGGQAQPEVLNLFQHLRG